MQDFETTEILGQKVKMIDLSHTLENTPGEPNPVNIKTITHDECAQMWEKLFGIPPEALPTGSGFAGEIIEASSHAGTHIDAPWHYSETTEEGKSRSGKIDDLPVGMFIGNAVVLDVSDLPTGHLITQEDIEDRLKTLGYDLTGDEIVLLHTGADRYWGTEEFFGYGCGLGEEAVTYLTGKGIKVIGTDAWSLDRPYPVITDEWQELGDESLLWPAHFAGRKTSYCQIEKLTNLDKLPPLGCTVICLPVKLKGGSGAWSRVIGLVPV